MIIIGIDPGKFGALCLLAPGQPPKITLMPDSIPGIINHLSQYAMTDVHVFLEKPTPKPGNSVKGTYTFAHHLGVLEAICAILGLPLTLVSPQTWMPALHVGTEAKLGTKERSILACQRLFPGVDLRHNYANPGKHHKSQDDNVAEACLIAAYGQRQLSQKVA